MRRILLFFFLTVNIQVVMSQKVLVVSGGGARGAWGGGIAQHLTENAGNDYDLIIGTSTGSLMAPLVAVNNFDLLREMYTGVTNKSIFNVNPFKLKKGRNGKVASIKVKQFRGIFRILFGKKTLGETKRLRKLIYKTYGPEIYKQFIEEGDEVMITVANLSNSEVYYFSSKQDLYNNASVDCEGFKGKELKQCKKKKDLIRKSFLDWIWRSSNQPLFMTLDCTDTEIVDVDGKNVSGENCWVDGGLRENIPLLRGIQYVLEEDPDLTHHPVIDVIINNIPEIDLNPNFKQNIVNSLFQTIGVLTYDVRYNDVNIPDEGESALGDHIEVNLHFMPQEIYDMHKWDLHFDKKGMTKLWQAGEQFKVETVPLTISKELARNMLKKGQEVKVCNGYQAITQ